MIALTEPFFDRHLLADEFHARPPLPVTAPAAIYVFAVRDLIGDAAQKSDHILDRNHMMVSRLAEELGIAAPSRTDCNSFCLLNGPHGHIKFERHTEFSSFVVVQPAPDGVFAAPIPVFCTDLLFGGGDVVMALRIHFLTASVTPDDEMLKTWLQADDFVGTSVSGGRGLLWTDFRIGPDGFGRILLQDLGMSPRRAGRLIQRLIDIETYRMLAMQALPLVHQITPILEQLESDVIDSTEAMMRKSADDGELLDRLVHLASRHEHLVAFTRRRFAATAAYRALVDRRLAELREERIEGLQRVSVFIERRFGPAMRTIESCAARQAALTDQITRSTGLLRTRVDVALEAQNQALLHSMDQRTAHQLRLQEAVEGLSLFAISYYLLGLIKYACEALVKLGVDLNPSMIPGLALPVVFVILLIGRRWLNRLCA